MHCLLWSASLARIHVAFHIGLCEVYASSMSYSTVVLWRTVVISASCHTRLLLGKHLGPIWHPSPSLSTWDITRACSHTSPCSTKHSRSLGLRGGPPALGVGAVALAFDLMIEPELR